MQMAASNQDIDAFVGARIREIRRGQTMTQMSMALDLGVSQQQVQMYETGKNRIVVSRLWRIAEVLGVSIETLFEGLGK